MSTARPRRPRAPPGTRTRQQLAARQPRRRTRRHTDAVTRCAAPRPAIVIRVDGGALTLARATLLNKVGERLAPRVENGEVVGFVDQEFIDAFGPGLSKLSDARLTQIALDLLVQHVSHAPTGKTGLKYFDAD